MISNRTEKREKLIVAVATIRVNTVCMLFTVSTLHKIIEVLLCTQAPHPTSMSTPKPVQKVQESLLDLSDEIIIWSITNTPSIENRAE